MNNYRLLPYLVSILKTLNLSKSALELNVTPSAMSKILNQIREEFNDQIIIREGGRFVLTPKGEQLQVQLPLLMPQLDNLFSPEFIEPARYERSFTLASCDYVAQAVFPAIWQEVVAHAPNVKIDYRSWEGSHFDDLSCRGVELVVTMIHSVPENIYGTILAEDPLVVIYGHRSKYSGHVSLDDYITGKHIVISSGGDKNSSIDMALSNIGVKRNAVISVPFVQAAIELLQVTDYFLAIPLHVAADFSQQYALNISPLPVKVASQPCYLLWHTRYHQDPEHLWFRKLCHPIVKRHLENKIQCGMKLIQSQCS